MVYPPLDLLGEIQTKKFTYFGEVQSFYSSYFLRGCIAEVGPCEADELGGRPWLSFISENSFNETLDKPLLPLKLFQVVPHSVKLHELVAVLAMDGA